MLSSPSRPLSRSRALTAVAALAVACSGLLAVRPAVAEPPGQPPGDPARSAPQWGPVTELAANPQSASVAVDGRGTTTVVWVTSTFPAQVVARQRSADGTWADPVVLGPGGSPKVVADRHGVVTVVWMGDGVLASRQGATGEWSAPVTLAADQSKPVGDLLVAANRSGAVVVAWTWGGVRHSRIQSVFRPERGSWGPVVDVTAGIGAHAPQMAIDADGRVTVVFGIQSFGEPQVLISKVRAGGAWGSARRVAAEGYDHSLAVAGDGRAVLVFTPDFSAARVTARSARGVWGRARTLVEGGEVNDTDVAVNPQGHFVVGVTRPGSKVYVIERKADGRWRGPVLLAKRGTVASDVMVAINAAHDTFVGWGEYGVYGRYRPHGGTWGPRSTAWPDTGADVLESADAVMAPNGDVAVLWDQEENLLRMRVLMTP